MSKSIPRIILSHSIRFLIFLVVLAIANYFVNIIKFSAYSGIVNFFNSSITILFIIAMLGIVNEIFWGFYFPFSILAPPVSAIMGLYILTFVYNIWTELNKYINANIQFNLLSLYTPVFFIVLAVSYIVLLSRIARCKKKPSEEEQEKEEFFEKKREKIKTKLEGKLDELDRRINEKQEKLSELQWREVGNEFKTALYNLGKSINNLFSKSDKDKDKKK